MTNLGHKNEALNIKFVLRDLIVDADFELEKMHCFFPSFFVSSYKLAGIFFSQHFKYKSGFERF